MPRMPGRRPTVDDFTPPQRRIWEMLPEEGRTLFLQELPPIRETAASRRAAELVRRRLGLLANLERHVRAETERLTRLLKQAEGGAKMDPPRELAALVKLEGIQIRFAARQRRQPRAAELAVGAAPAEPPARRVRKERRAAESPAPADAERAPFGRDPRGNPYMPFGATVKGIPARPRGKYGQREVDNFLALVREDPRLSDAEATAEYHRRKAAR